MKNKAVSCAGNREKISSLLDAELSGKEKQMLEKHLSGCITCRTLKEWLRCVKEGIARSANDVVISDSVREKILAALDQLPSETLAVPWWKRLLNRF